MTDYWWGRRRGEHGRLEGVTVSILGWVAVGVVIVIAITLPDLLMPAFGLEGFVMFASELAATILIAVAIGLPIQRWKTDPTGLYEKQNGVWLRVGEIAEGAE